MTNEMAFILGTIFGLSLCIRATLSKMPNLTPCVRKILMLLIEIAIVVMITIFAYYMFLELSP